MRPTGAATVAGVVGWPIRHSLSPLIHTAWLEACDVDGLYAPFAVSPERFDGFIDGLRGGAVRGLNVTAPHKERALALADEADASAREAGAANLLLFADNGRIEARSTDGHGLLSALSEQAPDRPVRNARVVLLGAGGAARSAAGALRAAGASELRIANRSAARAESLAAEVGARAAPWEERAAALNGADIVVNATSLGLEGGQPLDLDLRGLAPGAAVMDMIYRPLRTPLLQQAVDRGFTPVDGLAMLIGQAAPSFEAFYGPPPPPIDVRVLALEALR